MYSYLKVAVRKRLDRQRIIKILGISRINCKCKPVPEILAALHLLVTYNIRYLVGRILNFFLKLIRKIELSQNRMHLGIVLPRLSKHISDMSARSQVLTVPAVHHRSHFHSLPCSEPLRFFDVHFYIVRHHSALHQHPGLRADYDTPRRKASSSGRVSLPLRLHNACLSSCCLLW